MRLRISEINQHVVAHVFGDKAVKAADRLGDSAVVVPDQFTQNLGVESEVEPTRSQNITGLVSGPKIFKGGKSNVTRR